MPGYPRFRGVNWFDTVDFPKDGDGCRWDSTPHDPVTRVRLQGVGHVKVHQHRPVVGKVKTVSVKREGRKWFVVLTAEQSQPEPLPKTGSVVGIDLGIANFVADSGGGLSPTRVTDAALPRSSRQHSRHSPGFRVSGGRSGRHITAGRSRRSPSCTAGSAVSGSTTPTRPRWPWSVSTMSSHTKTSRSAT